MKTDNYDLISIFEHQSLEQFVVPEIQRDYVWKINDVKDFLDYINQGFSGDETDRPYLGFIYAYNDRDYPYKYMLIDGQQRLTTIFLLVLAVYHQIGKGLPEYLLNGERLKFDYKVRQATQDFMRSLVLHCKINPGTAFKIRDQIWFHNEYASDQTITNIINNYTFIQEWLEKEIDDLLGFAKFVEEGVRLSYFNIEESRQGEDLYIYMNSRGRHLEPNETLKAKYLAATPEKEKWGTAWENWQDFFWKNKGTRPDADTGFNDFLRLVQVISMSDNGNTSEEISSFIRAGSKVDPDFEQLPRSIEDLSVIFEAYVWFLNAPAVSSMLKKLGHEPNYFLELPEPQHRQIYFLRILPVIGFLYKSGCRDEMITMRFARFFYNLGRKRETVGKDIATQLPGAIRLMLQYGAEPNMDFDVCKLKYHAKGRSILIDQEEVDKLTILSSSNEQDREEVEQLLWETEDHPIFNGQISFFLERHYDRTANVFDRASFERSWEIFRKLFRNTEQECMVAVALMFYGNTWFQDTPHYYQNYACMDWNKLVQNEKRKYLGKLIDDLLINEENIAALINMKILQYFQNNGLDTVDSLKEQTGMFQQIAVLVAIDYNQKKVLFTGGNKYMAKSTKYTWGDDHFFKNSPNLFNVSRYVNEGWNGRLMDNMKEVLSNDEKLQEIINKILRGQVSKD